VCTGSYDLKAAHVEVDGVYTNKPPGGIAYRCSFRVTEAVHTIERMADLMAHELKMDPAEFRMKNFIKPEQNVGEGLETPARRGHTRLIFCVFCEQYSRSV
jgi:carbon-monoxide dehydrogenase large subunit